MSRSSCGTCVAAARRTSFSAIAPVTTCRDAATVPTERGTNTRRRRVSRP